MCFEKYREQKIPYSPKHTWQAGHQGALFAFLPSMMNHTWQAMHQGPLIRFSGICTHVKIPESLLGNIPDPLTIFQIGCAPVGALIYAEHLLTSV